MDEKEKTTIICSNTIEKLGFKFMLEAFYNTIVELRF